VIPADRQRGFHGRFLPFDVETDEIIRLRMKEKLSWMDIGKIVGMHYSSCIHRVMKDTPTIFRAIKVQPTFLERYFRCMQAYQMSFTMIQKDIARELCISIACVRKRCRIARRILLKR